MSEQRRPGRPARVEPAEAIGFRAGASLRKRMELARTFLDLRSHQALLEQAIEQRLAALRSERPEFAVAEDALLADIRKHSTDAGEPAPVDGPDSTTAGGTVTAISARKGRPART